MSNRSDQRHRTTNSILFLIAIIAVIALGALLLIDTPGRKRDSAEGPPSLTTVTTPNVNNVSENVANSGGRAVLSPIHQQVPADQLPEDLRAQVRQSPGELPEDLKEQLEAPPPPLPADIRDALSREPRLVSEDEVNGED